MPIVNITSLTHPGVEVFSSLTEPQLRNSLGKDRGLFIAESPKVIDVALRSGYEPVSLMCERRHVEGDARAIIERCGDIPVFVGDRNLLASLTGYALTRGVLCAMRRRPCPSIADICGDAIVWWSSTALWTPPTSEPSSVQRQLLALTPYC